MRALEPSTVVSDALAMRGDSDPSTSLDGFKARSGPSGLHLFDRKSGLNILLDEIKVPPSSWAPAPRQVSIALTNACDLSCHYCYAPKAAAALDPQLVIQWLDELDQGGCLGVGFGGGEPTLHRQLPDFCRHVAQRTSMAATFTTHAHRLDETILARLSGNVHFIRVSMDGVGATYEQLRGRSFAALRSRLHAVKALAPFGINFVVNAHTLPDLEAAISLAEEIGAKEFLLLPEQPVQGKGGIDPNTAQALNGRVSAYNGPVPLTVSTAGADGLPVCNPLPQEQGLRAYAHIDALGTLKACSFDTKGVVIGANGVMRALEELQTLEDERSK